MPRNFPALLIGLIIAAYWGRVLRMAKKAKRVCGHSANLIPREPIGRLTRLIWFPVVIFWIALPFTAAWGEPRDRWFDPLFNLPILSWFSVLVAAVAFGATWVCWKIMGKSWRMGIDPTDITPLVTQGPYSYVRHPIYALSSLLMICTVAALPSTAMMIVAVLHIMLLLSEARREEAYLSRVHGSVYEDYRGRVGRFIPRFFESTRVSSDAAKK